MLDGPAGSVSGRPEGKGKLEGRCRSAFVLAFRKISEKAGEGSMAWKPSGSGEDVLANADKPLFVRRGVKGDDGGATTN